MSQATNIDQWKIEVSYRLTLAVVLAAHAEAMTYGGRAGVLSLGSIESAIGRPYSGNIARTLKRRRRSFTRWSAIMVP